MYSNILLCSDVNRSLSDRSSATKSGQIGAKPFFCRSLRLTNLSRLTQDASGDRLAPFGNANMVEESQQTPLPSFMVHVPSCIVRLALRTPVSKPVPGITINSPVEVSSSRRSRYLRQSLSNCSGVTDRVRPIRSGGIRASGCVRLRAISETLAAAQSCGKIRKRLLFVENGYLRFPD